MTNMKKVNILGMEIGVEPDKDTSSTFEMIGKEWQKRFKKLREQFTYESGELAFSNVLDRIPSKPEYRQYAKSLELAGIRGLKKDIYGVSIRSRRYTRKIAMIDGVDTILYIRARRGMKKIDPKVSILEQHSPWTLDTIPFMPSKRDAVTVSRKVGNGEVTRIKKLRRKDSRVWKYELSRLNVRVKSNNKKLPLVKKAKSVPDTLFEALRMENAIGDKGAPHWRPGLLSFMKHGIASIKKRKWFSRAATDSKFDGWKKWPTRPKTTISLREAQSVRDFVKMLGIRATIR